MLKWFKKSGDKNNKDQVAEHEGILSSENEMKDIKEDQGAIDEKTAEESLETQDSPTEGKQNNFLSRLKHGLIKTKVNLIDQVDRLLKNYTIIDDKLYEELESILIGADVGMQATMDMIDRLQETIKEQKITDISLIKPNLKRILLEDLHEHSAKERKLLLESPSILLVVGVNGVGKTTTIGKLAYQLKNEGKKVILAAGDTFRAAATEQLKEWANRAQVDLIALQEGADPAAVIYDAIQAAKSRKADVLICDTAGRLHNKKNLMNELNKIFRIVDREYENANREILLVLDATTGQNAMVQAKTFNEVADITGMALTKLDGSAKGGIIVGLEKELHIPVKLVGVGEGIEDLQSFNPDDFVEALFE